MKDLHPWIYGWKLFIIWGIIHSHAEGGIELLFKANKCTSIFQKVKNVQTYYFSYSMSFVILHFEGN